MGTERGLNPLRKGEPFPTNAERWNPVFAAALKANGPPPKTPQLPTQPHQIWIANTSGTSIPSGRPVGIGSLSADAASFGYFQSFVFDASDPTTADNHAVTLQTIPAGMVGPAVVYGVVNVGVTGTEAAYVEPAAGNAWAFTDTETKFRVLDFSSSYSVAKVLIWPVSGAAGDGGSGSSGGSCCCPDDAYKLALPADWETTYPYGTSTDKRTAWAEYEHVHYFNFGTEYPLYFKVLSECTETVVEDGSILKFTANLTVDRPDEGIDTFYHLRFYFDNTPDIDILSLPHGFAASAPPTRINGGLGFAYGPSATDPYYAYEDGVFVTTGTDTISFEVVLRVNDVSTFGNGRTLFFHSGFDELDINRFYLECVDGKPATGESGEPEGGGGTPPI